MAFLVVYSLIVTVVLAWFIYDIYIDKNKTDKTELDKLQAQNEELRIQHNEDLKKLQESFGGKVKMVNSDNFMSRNNERRTSKRHKKGHRKANK